MADLRFSIDWLSSGSVDPVLRDTSAQLSIHLDEICLTRHEDVWSKTVRDAVLVSAYPLALWFASSWWRLNWEPLPQKGAKPPLDWRMVHEMGAANHGFVWPRVLFASDGEMINIWAESIATQGQSVGYLNGLNIPRSVSVDTFQSQVSGFIEDVLHRLDAVGCGQTDLASLWSFVQEDRLSPDASNRRRLEAQMGFDPEECPAEVMDDVLRIQEIMGVNALSELAPIFGRCGGMTLVEIDALVKVKGIRGHPQVSQKTINVNSSLTAPWQQGVDAARQLRAELGNINEPIDENKLLDLLGLTKREVDSWGGQKNKSIAIARPRSGGGFDFIPRKLHRFARRFEFARFLEECLNTFLSPQDWLITSDLATAKQKRQRAFAAEFLCPIQSLVSFLDGDYSEYSFENASEYFGVSGKTIESLLANNGYLELQTIEPQMPYRLTT
ncbi:MAG: hypothetical protein B7Y40_00690 [Gammaproteobacteria bacterium 28-57-27]|nr:MAG: hypothetical protein B7Y40_00690 [Gammaproteobacteria bacterium 28-57-27]